MLGQAGAGKTTELEKLAQVLCEQNTPPIFIPLNTYSNENIEGLITQWNFDYKIENSVLVLDGYDEIADINSFHRKLDSYVRKPHENPSIGIILCREMNQTFVEFAVRDYNKPMGVATYRTSKDMPERLRNALPDIEELRKLL